MFRTVDYLLRPKSIALVGASDSSRGGWVQEIYYNLEFSGFPAKLYLVNPKRRELWGRPVYSNFAAIPEPVDLALTVIPTAAVVDTLAEASANGLKCALIYAAQFGEGGDAEGQKRGQALLALSDKHGLALRWSGQDATARSRSSSRSRTTTGKASAGSARPPSRAAPFPRST